MLLQPLGIVSKAFLVAHVSLGLCALFELDALGDHRYGVVDLLRPLEGPLSNVLPAVGAVLAAK